MSFISIIQTVRNGRIYADFHRTVPSDGVVDVLTIKPSDDSPTYTKYISGNASSGLIDITPYCQSALTGNIKSVYDVILSDSGVSNGTRRGVEVKPIINGFESSTVSYYPNCQGGGTLDDKFLSKLPYLQVSKTEKGYELLLCVWVAVYDKDAPLYVIYRGEEDEIVYEITGPTTSTEGNVKYCLFSIDTIPQELILENDYKRYRIPIKVVPSGINTRRLLWRNEVGGVDAWSFEFLRESNFATTSEVFYSSTDGYTRTNRKSERLHTVETRELDDLTAEVVAYVIASPEVYLMENGTLVPIDIITEECRTYSDTELTAIQVAYRLKERETL